MDATNCSHVVVSASRWRRPESRAEIHEKFNDFAVRFLGEVVGAPGFGPGTSCAGQQGVCCKMSNEPADSGDDLQPRLQPGAPSAKPPVSGRFQPGNTLALKHGLRSARVQAGLMPEQAEARAALAERVAAIVADLGGKDGLSALALGQIERHASLELVDEYLWENLQRHGPLTGKGRTRAALTAWLSVVDRLQKSATTLGLERRTKNANPLDAVRAAVLEANR